MECQNLFIAGIAGYEGAAIRSTSTETERVLVDFFDRLANAAVHLRSLVGSDRQLIVSAGGTSLFDRVIVSLRPVLASDSNMRLILRSGACYFSDHGPIRSRLDAIAQRGLLGSEVSTAIQHSFQPALRLWAEVLSCPKDKLTICGFGLRDAAHDQGLPSPLSHWRDGKLIQSLFGIAKLAKLNDQHAFLECLNGKAITIGDIIEFGVSHPCTSMDKHGLIYTLDKSGRVQHALRTQFG